MFTDHTEGFAPQMQSRIDAARDEQRKADANAVGRKMFRANKMPPAVIDIVAEVAEKHGVTLLGIASKYAARHVARARHEAMYRVKEDRLDRSAPVIGRWFNRDHTVVYFALASHSARTGEPPLTTYNLNLTRRRNAANAAAARRRRASR
jgi:chromosomal replication initiation ATPase DnaA